MEDIIINYGSAVKSLESGKIGGYLVRYGKPDLTNDFFTKETDFGFDGSKSTPVFLNHRLPFKAPNGKTLRVKERIGEAILTKDDDGILIEAILFNRKRYESVLAKMGWSSGTANWLVDREKVGKSYHIKSWPLGVDASLTWEPCDPGNVCSLKSFAGEDVDLDDEEVKSLDDDSFFEPIEVEVKAEVSNEWTRDYINKLPDSCFAYIEPGGVHDAEGKTIPRSMRFFPYRNDDGKLDEDRVKEALTQIAQSNIVDEAKSASLSLVTRAAKTLGIEVDSGRVQTFTEHFLTVVSAVEDHTKTATGLVEDVETLADRIRNRLEFRESKDGRTISAAHRERMRNTASSMEVVIGAMTKARAHIVGLAEMAEPKPKADPEAGKRLAIEEALAEAAKFEVFQLERTMRHQ
jgi:hypothetical protein